MLGKNRPQLNPSHFAIQQHKENIQFMNPSMANGPKPLISPKKNQQSDRMFLDRGPTRKSQTLRSQRSPQPAQTERLGQSIVCCNHPNKRAEFRTSLEDGQEYFCGRCAAQLATQGCRVQNLQSSTGSQAMKLSKQNDLPHMPQYEEEPIYHQILDIIGLCNTVVGEHSSNIERFGSIEQQYVQQADLTAAFYDRLIQIIEEMKADHLSDLIQERDKYTQIADIQNDNLRENIIEVNVIKNDIQNHMQEVLEGIQQSGDTAECRESLEHYRQKLTLFRHQTEEQLESLAQVTRYSQPQIDQMVQSFENFLKVMWEDDAPAQQEAPVEAAPYHQLNSAMTVKNIHQILPRGLNYEHGENKRAFRNLEDEEEEEIINERKSPNFKKI